MHPAIAQLPADLSIYIYLYIYISIYLLSLSLYIYVQLIHCPPPPVCSLLNTQYRMHPAIAQSPVEKKNNEYILIYIYIYIYIMYV